MAYWLFKSEPGTWSWDDQTAAGAAGTEWTGVRNHLAKKQMQAMQLGDRGFFYHSVNEKRIVGVVEVSALAHPDSTDGTGTWSCVDIRAVETRLEPGYAFSLLAHTVPLTREGKDFLMIDSRCTESTQKEGSEPRAGDRFGRDGNRATAISCRNRK